MIEKLCQCSQQRKQACNCSGHASVFGVFLSEVIADERFSPYVDDKGGITFPDGFRTSMVHLGSWFVHENGNYLLPS